MKYLRRFNEAEVVEDYRNSKEIVKEYNSKKSTLESIFAKKDYTISEIESDIISKVFGGKKNNQNPLLLRYSNILKMERSLNIITGETIDDGKRKESIKKEIRDLKNQSVKFPESVDYYDDEISKLEDSIKKIDTRISDRSKEFGEIQIKFQEEKRKFDQMVIDYSKRSKDLY